MNRGEINNIGEIIGKGIKEIIKFFFNWKGSKWYRVKRVKKRWRLYVNIAEKSKKFFEVSEKIENKGNKVREVVLGIKRVL